MTALPVIHVYVGVERGEKRQEKGRRLEREQSGSDRL